MSTSAFELVESGPLRYLVSVPPATERGPVPVLCFLHGYDEAAPTRIEHALTKHGPLARSAAPAARERFLVVAPQLPHAGDIWHRFAADVETIVGDVVERFGGDAARWLLTGFSFGGNGVFDLATARPRRWRALWAVDPTRVPQTRGPADALDRMPVWLSVGAAARRLTGGFVRTLGLETAARRSGTAGPLSVPDPQPSRVYLDEGLDHVGSAASAYADARIYDWLLAMSDRARAGAM